MTRHNVWLTGIDENVRFSGSSFGNLDDSEVSSFYGLADWDCVDEIVGGGKLVNKLMDDFVTVVLVPGQGVARTSKVFAGRTNGWSRRTQAWNAEILNISLVMELLTRRKYFYQTLPSSHM